MAPTPQAWQRLAELLVQQRGRIDANAARFAKTTGLNYRLVYDIEHARRTNYRPATLSEVEAAYRLQEGTIAAFLAGETDDLQGERPGGGDPSSESPAGAAPESEGTGRIKGWPLRPNEQLQWMPKDPSLPGKPGIRYVFRWTNPDDSTDYIESSKAFAPERTPLEVAELFREMLARAHGPRILGDPERTRKG